MVFCHTSIQSFVNKYVDADRLRLITRVARLYYEAGEGQAQIARKLGLSQVRVSRMLKEAEKHGIVRISVHVPKRVNADVEERLEAQYGLREAIVTDVEEPLGETADLDAHYNQALSGTLASHLELILPTLPMVGVTAFSAAVQAGINAMRPTRTPQASANGAAGERRIVQVMGGLGHGNDQINASQLTDRLARMLGAEAVFLMAPGVVGSVEARDAILADRMGRAAFQCFDALSALVLGIGTLPTPAYPQARRDLFDEADMQELKAAGAVGDVCLRFFDADGVPVSTSFDERVLGISARQVMDTPRRIGMAGGPRKFHAIRAALRGGWLTTLVTDLPNAQRLLADS